MEPHSQGTQRQVELGRQHQDEQGLRIAQLPIQQAQANLHCHHGRAERAHQLERQGREERHPQHPERGPAVPFTGSGDPLSLHLALTQGFEGRQSLQHIQEMGAQAAEGGPLFASEGLGCAADQGHKDRQQRSSDQQHDPGQPVQREYYQQDGERHQRRQRQLRQVLAEIRLQGLDSGYQGGGQLAGALAPGIGGS